MIKERPILFSDPMVQAILEGRKTQTRRVVKPQPSVIHAIHPDASISTNLIFRNGDQRLHCPYGKPGDRLWVREAHALVPASAYRMSEGVQQTVNPADPYQAAIYRAGWDRSGKQIWRPSIHMPRWASRITPEITRVWIERLQDISEADAMAGLGRISRCQPRPHIAVYGNRSTAPAHGMKTPWYGALSSGEFSVSSNDKPPKTPWNTSRSATARVKNPLPAPTSCPYCSSEVKITGHKEIYGRDFNDWPWVYACVNPDCRSYVGMHPFTNIPLGGLANAALRAARKNCKQPFEMLWQSKAMTRTKAYEQLAVHMGIEKEACHFGWFNIDQCHKARDWAVSILRKTRGPV